MKKKLSRFALSLLAATLLSASIIVLGRVNVAEGPSHVSANSTTTVPIRGPVQVVRFTLYDTGIYPLEARAQQGLVTISIEDLSGSSSGLIVERVEVDARVVVGILNRVTNHLRDRAELRLPAGRYEVSDASRRSNWALLIVEP